MKFLKSLLAGTLSMTMVIFASPASADTILLSSTPRTGYFDLGDAPDIYGTTYDPTVVGSNGARHADGTNLYLGGSPTTGGAPDYETNTIPAIPPAGFATWDDLNGAVDEEKGVTFRGSFTQQFGTTMCNSNPLFYQSGCWGKVEVAVTVNRSAYSGSVFLDGWLDWAHDGTFDQTGLEHILTDSWDPTALGAWGSDTQTFTYWFLDGEGPTGPFYARFRVSEAANTPTGARGFGEVEDYGGLGHAQGVPEIDATSSTSALALLLGSLALLGERRRRRSSTAA